MVLVKKDTKEQPSNKDVLNSPSSSTGRRLIWLLSGAWFDGNLRHCDRAWVTVHGKNAWMCLSYRIVYYTASMRTMIHDSSSVGKWHIFGAGPCNMSWWANVPFEYEMDSNSQGNFHVCCFHSIKVVEYSWLFFCSLDYSIMTMRKNKGLVCILHPIIYPPVNITSTTGGSL